MPLARAIRVIRRILRDKKSLTPDLFKRELVDMFVSAVQASVTLKMDLVQEYSRCIENDLTKCKERFKTESVSNVCWRENLGLLGWLDHSNVGFGSSLRNRLV